MSTQKTAFLHFGGAFTKKPNGPFITKEVPIRESLLPWQRRGLSFSASGYGGRIPSTKMVLWENRWYRVYIAQYGNSGTAYIESKRKPVATVRTY